MTIRAAIIDLGNVLVTFDHRTTCRALAPRAGLSEDEVYDRLFTSGMEQDFDLGRIEEEAFLERVAAALGGGPGPEEVRKAWAEIFRRDEANLGLLQELAEQLRLVLLSNTNPTHFRACEALAPELTHFHARVLSYEQGTRKPEPEIFHRALELAGVEAAEAVFVDDGAEHVAAAAALGLVTVHHGPGTPMAPALRGLGLDL